MGLDPAKVKATVERYNGFVEAGLDEDFGRSGEHLVPMTGPFYAAPVTVSTSMTIGGVKINTNGEALKLASSGKGDVTLEPVPGLYATGEVCEWNCASGWTVLSAVTIGRIAGTRPCGFREKGAHPPPGALFAMLCDLRGSVRRQHSVVRFCLRCCVSSALGRLVLLRSACSAAFLLVA